MCNPSAIRTGLLAAMVLSLVWAFGCERQSYDAEAVGAVESGDEGTASSTSHHYGMRVGDSDVAAGEADEIVLEVLPSSDLKINLDFPWSIELDAPEGLELGASSIDGEGMDLTEEQARIPVSMTARGEGEYEVTGRANLSVCNDDICHILRDEPVGFVVNAH